MYVYMHYTHTSHTYTRPYIRTYMHASHCLGSHYTTLHDIHARIHIRMHAYMRAYPAYITCMHARMHTYITYIHSLHHSHGIITRHDFASHYMTYIASPYLRNITLHDIHCMHAYITRIHTLPAYLGYTHTCTHSRIHSYIHTLMHTPHAHIHA